MLLRFCIMAAIIWLPFIQTTPPNVGSADLRLDNIRLSDLPRKLQAFGIPEPLRSRIVREETERRKTPVVVPQEVEPLAPAVAPVGELFWIPTFCAEGQGCSFTWKCIGGCSSHWMVEEDGFVPYATRWTPLLPCSPGILCTVLSRIPRTPSVEIVAFQPFASLTVPIPLSWSCI